MLHLLFDRDRVEAIENFGDATHQPDSVLLFHLLLDHCGNGEDSFAGLTKDFQQRTILELSHRLREDRPVVHPVVQRPANRCVLRRQQQGGIGERVGKSLAVFLGQRGDSQQ